MNKPEPKKYAAFKTLEAAPMTRGEYCYLRGWDVPANENPADAGFLTIDTSLPSNLDGFNGHVSWQTEDQFAAFKETDEMSFGMAVEFMKAGDAISRYGWNAGGQYVVFISGRLLNFKPVTGNVNFRDAMFLHTADKQMVPWQPTQSDVLARDWYIVENVEVFR